MPQRHSDVQVAMRVGRQGRRERRSGECRRPSCASIFGLALLSALLVVPAGAQSLRGNTGSDETWRGIVKAFQQPTLTSELATPIAAIGAREGERFSKGSVLIAFDCRRQQHDAAALAASVRETLVTVETNGYLLKRGAANANDVEIAKARHDKAVAELASLTQRLTGCSILAPFDGVVVEVMSAAFKTPPTNKPLMTITSIDQLEIEIIVPSRRLAGLPPGKEILFAVDETVQQHRARILRRGGTVDTVSQTAKIYAVFTQPPDDILPGMSGTATPFSGAP